jgi:transcriptional regulator with XRE-family HTH domain
MSPKGAELPVLTSELIRAARALLRWEQKDLAGASAVSLATIKRLEASRGNLTAHRSTLTALRRTLEAVGIEFTNGSAPGVRLRADSKKKDPGGDPGP